MALTFDFTAQNYFTSIFMSKFSTTSRFPQPGVVETPGPGQYDVDVEGQPRSSLSFAQGERFDERGDQFPELGPGKYFAAGRGRGGPLVGQRRTIASQGGRMAKRRRMSTARLSTDDTAVDELNREMECVTQGNSTLKKNFEEKMRIFQEQLDNSSRAMNDIMSVRNKLEVERDGLRVRVDEVGREQKEYIVQLEEEVNVLRNEREKLQTESEVQSGHLIVLTERLRTKEAVLSEAREKAEHSLMDFNSKLDELNRRIERKDDDYNELLGKHGDLEQQQEILHEKYEDVKKSLFDAEQTGRESAMRADQLQNDLGELSEKYENSQSEIAEISKKYEKSQSDIRVLRDGMRKLSLSLKQEREKSVSMKNMQETDADKLAGVFDACAAELHTNCDRIKRLKATLVKSRWTSSRCSPVTLKKFGNTKRLRSCDRRSTSERYQRCRAPSTKKLAFDRNVNPKSKVSRKQNRICLKNFVLRRPLWIRHVIVSPDSHAQPKIRAPR
eukprot:529518_1